MVTKIELVGVETESEMSGLVKVVAFVAGATKIKYKAIKQLIMSI